MLIKFIINAIFIGTLALPIPCNTPVTTRDIAIKGNPQETIFKNVIAFEINSGVGLKILKRVEAFQKIIC